MALKQELDEETEMQMGLARQRKEPRAEPYTVGELVLCLHTDNLLYEVKIVAVEKQDATDSNGKCDYNYTIHYHGWSKKFDENILHSQTAERFFERTPVNLERFRLSKMTAKAIRDEERRKKKKKRTSGISAGSSTKDGRAESRETSPIHQFFNWLNGKDYDRTFVLEKVDNLLESDRQSVEERLMIHKLPARYSVAKILAEYAANAREIDTTNLEVKSGDQRAQYWKATVRSLDECTESLQSFFDSVIKKDILLKNERPQYKVLVRRRILAPFDINDMYMTKHNGLRPSEYYGFMHLLRLADVYERSVVDMCCDEESKKVFMMFAQSLLVFLARHSVRYYDPEGDYEHAPPSIDKCCKGLSRL